MRKKLKDTGGLTMVEMLCTVVILILLILMMNTGMHMAVRNYYYLTSESETELLLSSLTDTLADKLRYAVVTKTKTAAADGTLTVTYELFLGGEKIVLTEADILSGASLDALVGLDDGMVVIKDTSGAAGGKKLLPAAAYGKYNRVNHDQSGIDPIKYTVEKIPESPGPGKPIVTCKLSGDNIMFEINLQIKDDSTGINSTGIIKEAKELSVRCLNPVRELP